MLLEEPAKESRWFFWLTQIFVIFLFSLQLALCLQKEWGGGFSISDIKSLKFFNFHPLLNILAFGVAMTESLIAFKAFALRRKTAKTLHALLQLFSFLFALAAFLVVLLFHKSNKFPDFYSVHSWIGLTVYILSWCQFLLGTLIFWLPDFAPPSVKAGYLRYHKVGGIAIYGGALAAVVSGLMQKQSFLRSSSPKAELFGAANLLANALAVLALLTSFAGSKSCGGVGAVGSL